MSISSIQQRLPDYAKDTKLNLSKVLSEEGSPGLSALQIHGVALACAYTTRQSELIQAMSGQFDWPDGYVQAAKAAASIMAMNNIYYRFVHTVSDASYQQLPAQLRMNIMANPGADQIDFELMSLAVSAINGCGFCVDSHVNKVAQAGISQAAIQSCVRIAAVMAATAQTLVMEASD